MKLTIMLLMQYLHSMCVPNIFYCNSVNALLYATWIKKKLNISFSHLISAGETFSLTVKLIPENYYYSIATILSQRELYFMFGGFYYLILFSIKSKFRYNKNLLKNATKIKPILWDWYLS